jgi:hypothetical protein
MIGMQGTQRRDLVRDSNQRRILMSAISRRGTRLAAYFVVFLAGISVIAAARNSGRQRQEEKLPQNFGIDNARMGTYRALAQLCFQAYQKADFATAGKLARILERSWDRGESQERAAGKPNATLYNQIDAAMDAFVVPLEQYARGDTPKPPDASKVQAAYDNYLEKLKTADAL